MSSRNPRRGSPRPLRTLAVLAFAALVLGLAFVVRSLGQLPDPTIDAARLVDAPYGAPVWSGRLENPALIEASGFARSHRDPARLWAINDSGHAAVLYALGFDGAHQGTLTLLGVENDDWEDLASVVRDGAPYLLVADTGDNLSRKALRTLHAVFEPALAGAPDARAAPAWSLVFRFEDGPRDCEAVAVDPVSGEILLLSKRDVPARLYALAWPEAVGADAAAPALARFVAEVRNIPQPTRLDGAGLFPIGPWLAQPTAMAISPAGDAALVLTYGAAYRFARTGSASWAEAFRALPTRLRVPPLRGYESIGFSPDGRSLFLAIEGRGAPIYRFDAKEPAPTPPRL